jgi:hypothetical protein
MKQAHTIILNISELLHLPIKGNRKYRDNLEKATQLRVSRIVNQYIGCDALTIIQYDLQVISMPISKKSYRDH